MKKYLIMSIYKKKFLLLLFIHIFLLSGCKPEQHGLHPFNENILTIGEYIKTNQDKYSKFSRLLNKGDLLITLGGYNPHGDGYTLFLPTNEAVNQFIQQNKNYSNFEEMLQDTTYVKQLARYHTINKSVHSDEFPDGALINKTLTGHRLVTGFYADDDNQLIKVNNVASLIESNKEMTNGYIHVISEVLQPVEISGYDWLQQQDDYSILAETMEYYKIRNRLWFKEYTILAEPDSVYHRYGIMNLEDLKNRFTTEGGSSSGNNNSLYQFVAYHILSGDFYLNDLNWGRTGYRTLSDKPITIVVGQNIRFNPGVDVYRVEISESGDTTAVIDYISPIWESSNILTKTGPVHSISEVLFFEPLPKQE